MSFKPLDLDDLASVTGGSRIIRANTSGLDAQLKTQLDSLGQSVKDVANASTNNKPDMMPMMLAMMVAKRNQG